MLLRAHDDGPTAYDYVLIDCPPSLNLLTLNAMAAADAVLVPLAMRVLRSGRAEPADAHHRHGQAQPQSRPWKSRVWS
jgi:Mrp family chromosome partitioning ATPase